MRNEVNCALRMQLAFCIAEWQRKPLVTKKLFIFTKLRGLKFALNDSEICAVCIHLDS